MIAYEHNYMQRAAELVVVGWVVSFGDLGETLEYEHPPLIGYSVLNMGRASESHFMELDIHFIQTKIAGRHHVMQIGSFMTRS